MEDTEEGTCVFCTKIVGLEIWNYSSSTLGAHVRPQGPLGLIPSHFSLLVPGETISVTIHIYSF